MGIFSTLRFHHNKLEYLEEHYERLKLSCHILGLPLPSLEEIKVQIAKQNLKGCMRVKFCIIKSGMNIQTQTYSPLCKNIYQNGLHLQSQTHPRNQANAKLKLLANEDYKYAMQRAQKSNFDDGIFINEKEILETTRANLLMSHQGKIFQARKAAKRLIGIMENQVIKALKIKPEEGINFPPPKNALLYTCNSMQGIIPVKAINTIPLTVNPNDKIAQLINIYQPQRKL